MLWSMTPLHMLRSVKYALQPYIILMAVTMNWLTIWTGVSSDDWSKVGYRCSSKLAFPVHCIAAYRDKWYTTFAFTLDKDRRVLTCGKNITMKYPPDKVFIARSEIPGLLTIFPKEYINSFPHTMKWWSCKGLSNVTKMYTYPNSSNLNLATCILAT